MFNRVQLSAIHAFAISHRRLMPAINERTRRSFSHDDAKKRPPKTPRIQELGLIAYNGRLAINTSVLSMVLMTELITVAGPRFSSCSWRGPRARGRPASHAEPHRSLNLERRRRARALQDVHERRGAALRGTLSEVRR
jgi:hypothetical protein